MLHFVGIGAQKAGTTWVYENLLRHPQVRFPATKEVHFWDFRYTQGIEWYKSLFSTTVPGALNGEITPAYAILPAEKIRECRAHFPDIRLFYIMRNPIDRAWSAALMALRRAEMTLDEASDQWFIDHFQSKGSMMRGDYATCIDNWCNVYPQEQLLLLAYEDMLKDPVAFIQACCRHIGVDPDYFKDGNHLIKEKIFDGGGQKIRPVLKEYLHQTYASPIEKLKKIPTLPSACFDY